MIQDLVGQRLVRHGTEEATYVPINEKRIDRVAVVSLRFSSASVQIENPFRVEAEDGSLLTLDMAVGKEVVAVHHLEDKELRIVFQTMGSVVVSLLEEDYRTPEALSYYPDKGSIVVFN